MLAKKNAKDQECLIASKFQEPLKPGSGVLKSYYDPPKANIYGNLLNSYVSNNICVLSADFRGRLHVPIEIRCYFYQGHL
jgi:hypothetical protein